MNSLLFMEGEEEWGAALRSCALREKLKEYQRPGDYEHSIIHTVFCRPAIPGDGL
jgi:hypothetical protein